MRLLPYDRFTIVTHLDAETVRQRLADDIEPTRWFRFFGPCRSFQGTISESRFKIERLRPPGRNWLIIFGQIVKTARGTEIRVFARLHWFMAIPLGIWLVGILAGVVGTTVGVVAGAFPLGVPIFFAAAVLLAFAGVVAWIRDQAQRGRAALEWALREPRLPPLGP